MGVATVVLFLTLTCIFTDVSGQLFRFHHPIAHEPQTQCDFGMWSFNASLRLADDKVLKFFVPMVVVQTNGEEICSIDLTSCHSNKMLPNYEREMHIQNSCYCTERVGNMFYLSASVVAKMEHSGSEVTAEIPLRYSWFKFSKKWVEYVGQVPKISRPLSANERKSVLFVPGYAFNPNFMDKGSMIYRTFKNLISSYLQPQFGGALSQLNFEPRENCLLVEILWKIDQNNKDKAMTIADILNDKKFDVNGQVYTMTTKSCPTTEDLYKCPPVRSDPNSCNLEDCAPGSNCTGDYRCCPSSCSGQHKCTLVGFSNALSAQLASSLPYSPQLQNPNSPLYKSYEKAIIKTVEGSMKNVMGYKSTIVKGFSAANSGRRRRRRQTGGTVADVQMQFTMKFDVKDVKAATKQIENTPIVVNGQSYSVSNMAAGDKGNCPDEPCSGDSVCLTNSEGEKYCECPDGYEGPICNKMVSGFEKPLTGMMLLTELLSEYQLVMETVMYTSQMSNKLNVLSGVTSFDSFCAIKPDDLFMLAPGSPWDYKKWMSQFCSMNIDNIWVELQQSPGLMSMPGLLPKLMDLQNFQNITGLLEKLQAVVPTLQLGLKGSPGQYAETLELIKFLNTMLQAPMMAVQQSSSMIFSSLESVPEVRGTYPYMRMVFDTAGQMASVMSGSIASMKQLRRLPNINIVMKQMKKVPMVLQTAMYTMMTEPMKMGRMVNAMSSWDGFCGTPTLSIFTTPPELASFDMDEFKNGICQIKPDQMMAELTQFPATSEIMKLIINGYLDEVSSGQVQDSFNKMLSSFMKILANPEELLVYSPMAFVFDQKMWDQMFSNMGKWLDSMFSNLEIDGIMNVGFGIFNAIAPDISAQVMPWYNKVIAVGNLLMDQAFIAMNNQLMNSTFAGSQSLQMLYGLLNELPEAEHTLMWTIQQKGDKLAQQLSQVSSFTDFCAIKPADLFVSHPNSTWDFNSWMGKLCSLNIDGLMKEVSQISVVTQIEKILADEMTGNSNMTDLLQKAGYLLGSLEAGFDFSKFLTEPSVFGKIMVQLSGFEKMAMLLGEGKFDMVFQNLIGMAQASVMPLSKTIFSALENMPVVKEAFPIMDLVLDMLQLQIDEMTGAALTTLRQYPNVNNVMDRLSYLPELLQTVMHTVFNEPVKLGNWFQALQSWKGFCDTPTDTLFSVPDGLMFNMTLFKSHLCMIDADALLKELEKYQGSDRVEILLNGGSLPPVNTSQIEEKFNHFFTSLTNYIMNPEPAMPNDTIARLFEEKLWNNFAGGIMNIFNSFPINSPNPMVILNAIKNMGGMSWTQMVFTAMEATPQLKMVLPYINFIFEMGAEQIKTLTWSSVTDLRQYPNLNITMNLLSESPMLIKTVMFTVLTEPMKLAKWSSALQSWDKFCSFSTDSIFSVPPEIQAQFDMNAFKSQMCSIQPMPLVGELSQLQDVNKFMALINGSLADVSGPQVAANFDSLLESIKIFMNNQSEAMPDDPIFHLFNDAAVWTDLGNYVMGLAFSQFNNIMSLPPQNIMNLLSSVMQSAGVTLFSALEMIPDVKQAFPFMNMALEMMNLAMDHLTGASTSAAMPTANKILDLAAQLPELLQTVLNTVFNEPNKLANWLQALQSWQSFCQTPTANIFEVPSWLPNFDMNSFKSEMCTIDPENLLKELSNYQGSEKVMDLIASGKLPAVNSSEVNEKFVKFVSTLMSVVMNPEFQLSDNTFARIFNESLWNNNFAYGLMTVFSKFPINSMDPIVWLNFIKDNGATYIQMVFTAMEMSPEVKMTFPFMKIAFELIGQELDDFRWATLLKMRNYTNSNYVLTLLSQLPELVQTVVYTSLMTPTKLSLWTNAFVSWEVFCYYPADSLFSVPPAIINVFDMNSFKSLMCKIDIMALGLETDQYAKVAPLVNKLIENATAVMNEQVSATDLATKFNDVIISVINFLKSENETLPNDPIVHLFDENAWNMVGYRVMEWVGGAFSMVNDPFKMLETFFGFLSGESSSPLSKLPVLPVFMKTVSTSNLMLNEYLELKKSKSTGELAQDTNLVKLVGLLKELPEMMNAVLYTEIQKPNHLSLKLATVQTLEAFCAMNMNELLTMPPGSSWNADSWKSQLCSIDVENFLKVLPNAIQFVNEAEAAIIYDNFNGHDNVTMVIEKLDDALDTAVDASRWSSLKDSLFYFKTKDYLPVYRKTLAMTNLVLKEMLMLKNNTAITNKATKFPSTAVFDNMIAELPDLFNALIYTSIQHPKKLMMKLEGVQSFQQFCSFNKDDMFMLPPNSTWNFKDWLVRLCSIDTTNFLEAIQANGKSMDFLTNVKKIIYEHNYMGLDKITMVIESANSYLESPFAKSAWEPVMKQEKAYKVLQMSFSGNNLLMNAQSLFNVVKMFQGPLSSQLFSSMEMVPELKKSFPVMGLVFDVMADLFPPNEQTLDDLRELNEVNKTLNLLSQAPHAIATCLYTLTMDSKKVGQWYNAFQSWKSFCDMPADSMATVPPQLQGKFDFYRFKSHLCSIDESALLKELSQHQGVDALLNDGTMMSWNSKDVSTKFNNFLNSLISFTESGSPNLPDDPFYALFSENMWNEFGAAVSSSMDKAKNMGQAMNMNLGEMGKLLFDLFNKLFPMAGNSPMQDFMKVFSAVVMQFVA